MMKNTVSIQNFLKCHPALGKSQLIQDLCLPLKKIGITYFSHVVLDNKNRFAAMASHPDFFHLYIDKGYHQYGIHRAPQKQKEQYTVADLIEKRGKLLDIHEDFKQFNTGHLFSISYQHDEYKECFHFGASLENQTMNHQYLSHLDTIKHFITYYKDKVSQKKPLGDAYDLKLQLTDKDNALLGLYEREDNDELMRLNQSHLKRYYIRESYITYREYQILHMLSLAKTGQEIALILNITERTVKAHIKAIKEKFHCYNQFQLGQLFAEISFS